MIPHSICWGSSWLQLLPSCLSCLDLLPATSTAHTASAHANEAAEENNPSLEGRGGGGNTPHWLFLSWTSSLWSCTRARTQHGEGPRNRGCVQPQICESLFQTLKGVICLNPERGITNSSSFRAELSLPVKPGRKTPATWRTWHCSLFQDLLL